MLLVTLPAPAGEDGDEDEVVRGLRGRVEPAGYELEGGHDDVVDRVVFLSVCFVLGLLLIQHHPAGQELPEPPVGEVDGEVDQDIRGGAPVEDLVGRGDVERVPVGQDNDQRYEGGEESRPLSLFFLCCRLPEVLDVMTQAADEDHRQDDQRPVLPGLEGVVPVEEHALRVHQVQALVEDVARADVVQAQAGEGLAGRPRAREVLPAVCSNLLAVLWHRRPGPWHGLSHVGRAQGPGARVAREAVPVGLVQVAQDGVGRVRVDGPEVDADGAGAGQDKRGPALPPRDGGAVRDG